MTHTAPRRPGSVGPIGRAKPRTSRIGTARRLVAAMSACASHANPIDRFQEAKDRGRLGEVAAIETATAAATQESDVIATQFGPLIGSEQLQQMKRDLADLEKTLGEEQISSPADGHNPSAWPTCRFTPT
ncbi:hypothetical protein [Streptomyces sp. AB3(2024)]|uniref:hypothetical protein n=1 Tax=Streptomyces sp. AB3(2024) TaxID=3317321 RepID=UPI0035A27C9F